MNKSITRSVTTVFAIFITVLLTGCVGMQTSGPQVFDPHRMQQAVALDDVGFVRSAIESRLINANQGIPAMGYESIPLIAFAARNGAVDVIKYLISAGVDVNVRTPDGDTPLMLATYFSGEEDNSSPASKASYDQSVRLLVNADAELENWGNLYTPLGYAAYQGRDAMVQYLLKRGARVNADAEGRLIHINTPLMMATMEGHRSTVLQLLRAGADPGIRVSGGGMTAYEFARKYNHSHMFDLFTCAESLRAGEAFAQRCK
jgi:uncharacterized protein